MSSCTLAGPYSRFPWRARHHRAPAPSAGRHSRCRGPGSARTRTRGRAWGILVVHGRGTAGQDDGARPRLELVVGRIVQQFGVDVELAYAASDQLRELAAEVEDRPVPWWSTSVAARDPGPARGARSRDTPRPPRHRGQGHDARHSPARRGRSCRARVRPVGLMSRSTPPPNATLRCSDPCDRCGQCTDTGHTGGT